MLMIFGEAVRTASLFTPDLHPFLLTRGPRPSLRSLFPAIACLLATVRLLGSSTVRLFASSAVVVVVVVVVAI